MSVARHPRPAELQGMSIEELAQRYVARFRDRKADWAAFEDAKVEGYKRAQHRFIGAGGSGKHGDATVIPPRGFTLSIMYVEPGQGNAAHTHEVEEIREMVGADSLGYLSLDGLNASIGLPASTCRWMWETDCPAPSPQLKTVR